MNGYTDEHLRNARKLANLLQLASLDVALFDVSGDANRGVEYRGPCPFCHDGHDRFVVFTESDGGQAHNGRFWCRVCGRRGDGLQYLMYKHDWDLPTAVNRVNGEQWQPPARSIDPTGSKPAKKRAEFDYVLWMSRLEKMLVKAVDALARVKSDVPGAAAASQWLARRGIGGAAIGRYGIGYNPEWKNIYGDYRLPPGLLLPRFANMPGLPVAAVNCYLPKKWHEKYGRRRFVRGSKEYGMQTAFGEHLITYETTAVWVTTGELDAACLSQFLPDGHEAITWGGDSCIPDDTSLMGGRQVYLCCDNDKSGANALAKWDQLIPSAIVANVPKEHKDFTDYWRAVGNEGVNRWLQMMQ